MFLIKTYVDKSPIHGLGAYAGEDVSKGRIIWREIAGLDVITPPSILKTLPPVMLEYMETYGYYFEGAFHLNLDNAKYSNHADDPNMLMNANNEFYACRNIKRGEEITCNYNEFSMSYDLEDEVVQEGKKHVSG